ncbi:MAG: DM13 domain-containing protein [Egibacteraceae bacterium]
MSRLLRLVTVLAVLALVAAGCGGSEPAADPLADPFEEVERATPDPDAEVRSAPRWEQILTLSGDGSDSAEFPIPEDALQWRVIYSCESGDLRVEVDAADEPLVDTACPASEQAFSIDTGFLELDIEGSGPWEVTVEQQVDSVHEEPPLDGMEAAEVVAEGQFAGVERSGAGTATLYRMPDGSLALRFTDFQTVASPDLFVWVSEQPEPTTSAAVFEAEYVDLGEITATLGDQNYRLPDGVTPEQVASIVIWCAPLQIAYAAAPMSPTP